MIEDINQPLPRSYRTIEKATQQAGFTMASDIFTCSLLRTLAASKVSGHFLELGTGTGLATSWILEGMDQLSTLISIDSDSKFQNIAREHLGGDPRLSLLETDGEAWIQRNKNESFDFIFADTWPGKFFLLDEVLHMLTTGGLYIIDDMLPQPNWPEGHELKVLKIISDLEARSDLTLTKLNWSTGLIIAAKK